MKEKIILEIQKIANELGTSPGQKTFANSTGITEKEWKGVYWARWGDALRDAGLAPNTLQERYNDDFLLKRYCDATRHFGKAPTKAELRMHSKTVDAFPSYTTMQKHFGTFANLRAKARSWASLKEGYSDVVPLLPAEESTTATIANAKHEDGWVYLLQSGTHYKIGRGQNLERRVKQISISLPEKVELVHAIQTDDPSGIESYWHRRFADRRANGEWFNLTPTDVKAFKRRKFQ